MPPPHGIDQRTMNIVVLGDSIAEGLGAAGKAYPDQLAERLSRRSGIEVRLVNLAYTAFQISDSVHLLGLVRSSSPDLVIIAHGISEALVRPAPRALRFAPARWRNKGWMDPRPYFSRRWHRRL